MSASKIKKLFVSFLILSIIGILVIPSISLAAEYWAAIQTDAPVSTGYSTETECNTQRLSRAHFLVAGGKGDSMLTECFKYSQSKSFIFDEDYPEFLVDHPAKKASEILAEAGENNWWFTFKYTKDTDYRKAGDHVVAGPYVNKTECEKYLNALNKNETVVVKECNESTTKPVTPASAPPPSAKTTYTPLAPLPLLGTPGCIDENGDACIDTQKSESNPCPFGNYLNTMIKIFLGICAVLAMVMIVIGGIEYMTSDLASSKEAGKKTITMALLGLLLALGAYLILKTINPALLDVCLDKLPKVSISADEKLFAKTETPVKSVGAAYQLKGTFNSPLPSAGVLEFKNKLSQGYSINKIIVSTGALTATILASDGNSNTAVNVPIKVGQNGVSEAQNIVEGDGKTPKGITRITSDRRPAPNPPTEGKAALTRDGSFNMGSAFINFGATVNGKDRGMGFHGRFESGLGGPTNGCIRMSNDDLVVLAPYLKPGIEVIIQ